MREDDIKHKRTLIAYKEGYVLPAEANQKTGVLKLESGERVNHIRVWDKRGISAYACALELTSASFYYIPEHSEVLYIISRIRNPQYSGGHTPKGDAVCDVYRGEGMNVYVRIGFHRINVYGSDHLLMSDAQRQEWRDYLVEWIEDRLILQEG